ncbi:transcriptional regulator BetI [Providencia rustigianii]|uniref:Transcriptional regulator, TetR family n=2 Tax=Providencia rustigianii TaxID=158850 RepID=D1P7C1_9GAMM|nr:TetR/AcrR family transcriptional regulator [Providencia rustigianii]EFB70661.1 transcriptional regulator, TetR family [Providencia rustigianii DSM 4541]MTC59884.1 TetR family transcriptional regulator [Providencia rustigianii]SPY75928.1 transcriptional regulator BetI [Providencia rustigianii]SUC25049.1 transcriptional regulator BetI [Providencia rustigianii]SUC33881.1 transcriptional regulator BetI [Providencia rustigianii]
MGRQRKIDRDKVLEAAEEIVIHQGATALTIDAVAKAMGISKGGVQYCFGNKEALIDAMFERWSQSYDEIFNRAVEQDNSPEGLVIAHVKATADHDKTSIAKGAALMASLLQTPEYLESTRKWYRERIENLDLSTESGKRARMMFLAAEGAFILRYFGLMEINDEEWQSIFIDMMTVFKK